MNTVGSSEVVVLGAEKMKLLLNCFLVLVLFINIACKEEHLPSPSNGPNPDYDSINQDVISNNNTSNHSEPYSEPHSDPHCTNDNDDNSPVDDLLGNVDQLMCSKKCEKNYTALKKIDEIDPYGHFAFANTGWADGIGRCRGMTIMQQQYNMLADFNKGPNPHNCGRGKPMTAQCKNFYKSLIADIQSNKVAEIPGFKGLHEFSRDPYIQTLLRKKHILTAIDIPRILLRLLKEQEIELLINGTRSKEELERDNFLSWPFEESSLHSSVEDLLMIMPLCLTEWIRLMEKKSCVFEILIFNLLVQAERIFVKTICICLDLVFTLKEEIKKPLNSKSSISGEMTRKGLKNMSRLDTIIV